MSSGIESSGSNEIGFELSSVAVGGEAEEGEGRGKETAPSKEDSVIGAIALLQIVEFVWLLGSVILGTWSVDLQSQQLPP